MNTHSKLSRTSAIAESARLTNLLKDLRMVYQQTDDLLGDLNQVLCNHIGAMMFPQRFDEAPETYICKLLGLVYARIEHLDKVINVPNPPRTSLLAVVPAGIFMNLFGSAHLVVDTSAKGLQKLADGIAISEGHVVGRILRVSPSAVAEDRTQKTMKSQDDVVNGVRYVCSKVSRATGCVVSGVKRGASVVSDKVSRAIGTNDYTTIEVVSETILTP